MMKKPVSTLLLSLALAAPSAFADFTATFTTLITTPLVVEGLTNDDSGNLYAPGRNAGAGLPCPVYKTPMDNPVLSTVGLIPAPTPTTQCSPSGLAFGPDGKLYVTETDRIYRFTPNASAPPAAELFASGVSGTNGLAFDEDGNLWTGDGTTGVGRVWKITPAGAVTEMFRIPPMVNSVGVGRNAVTVPPGTAQPLVANGVAFDRRGDLWVADTARGAFWRVRIRGDGTIASRVGCDTTYTPNTLCMENLEVAHPLLEGADGFLIDLAGNFWVSANERNAIVYVQSNGFVFEVFRNPPDATTKLRNVGPLESPTSPTLTRHRFCTANSDGNRRDNSPNAAGEISPTGAFKGKISCMDQRIPVDGMRLPVH